MTGNKTYYCEVFNSYQRKGKKRKLLQGELVGGFNAIAVLEESARDQ